ncbi:MAG: hypothetical protein G01um101416_897 [Microgenomates group bacterium Gr01-1014_16]|nr:MAG: hypothetical protein G01um101416_897 [Microgenomates group bacterium Gr01-1014_16]
MSNIKGLVENRDARELRQLVLRLVEQDPGLEERVRMYLMPAGGGKPMSYYRSRVRVVGDWDDNGYYGVMEGEEELKRMAEILEDKGEKGEAIKAWQAILEAGAEGMGEIDDSDGEVAEDIREAMERWSGLVAQISGEVKKEHLDYVAGRWDDKKWSEWEFEKELFGLVISKVTRDEGSYLLGELEKRGRTGDFYRGQKLRWLEKWGSEGEYLEWAKKNLNLEEARVGYLDKLAKRKEWEEAIKTATDELGREKERRWLVEMLAFFYRQTGDRKKEKEMLYGLYVEGGEWWRWPPEEDVKEKLKKYEPEGGAYERLRRLGKEDGSWEKWRDRMIGELKEKKDVYGLVDVYSQEKMGPELVELGREVDDERELEKIAQALEGLGARETEEVYRKLVEKYLSNHLGREHYQKAAGWLEGMKRRGETAEFEAFLMGLRKKYYNRRAFLDEVREI